MPFTIPEALTRIGVPHEVAKYEGRLTGNDTTLQGTFTLNGATNVVVAAPALGPLDQIIYTLKTVGGTVGTFPVVKVRTNGTGFQVAGTAADTSVYDWRIMKGTL